MTCNCANKSQCECHKGDLVQVNATVTGKASRTTFDGRELLIIPVVALVAGVVNGALVTVDELKKFVPSWEGRPIPVRHPNLNGVNVSANIPEIMQASVIGTFQRVTFNANKLSGEIWLDVQRAIAKGFESVLNALESGDMMEVSTAYFADTVRQGGMFNNKTYDRQHVNLRPDHLALLPDEIGACSIDDGCGTHRNSSGKTPFQTLVTHINDKLDALITNFKAKPQTEAPNMNKIQLIAAIIAHSATRFTDEHKPMLEAMDEKALAMILPDDKTTPTPATPATNNAASAASGDDRKFTAEERSALDYALNLHKSEKSRLVAELTANKKCTLSKDILDGMTVEALQGVASMLGADYSHRGAPVTATNDGKKVEPLPSTPVVLAAMDGKKTDAASSK